LYWWHAQQREYPSLSQIARDYLCIQATGVASEQAFLLAGQTISSSSSVSNCQSLNG